MGFSTPVEDGVRVGRVRVGRSGHDWNGLRPGPVSSERLARNQLSAEGDPVIFADFFGALTVGT